MIWVCYDRRGHRVTVTGHAGYAERGADILCAAASMLLHTLAGAVRGLCERGLAEDISVNLRSGAGEVSCVPVEECRCVVMAVMDSIVLGFRLLAADYPEYVQFAQGAELEDTRKGCPYDRNG